MKIIWFSEIKWSYLRTRKQHILAKFPSSDEILFIEPISFNLKNKFNISKAFNRNIKHITIPQIQNSDIKILNYLIHFYPIRKLIKMISTLFMNKFLKKINFKPDVIITSNVFWIDYLNKIKNKHNLKIIYDCNDNPLAFPNAINKMNYFNKTLKYVNHIIVPYKSYKNFIPKKYHKKIDIISNGVDQNLISHKLSMYLDSTKLKNIDNIIMYIGSIDTRLDYNLISDLVNQFDGKDKYLKEFNFVFIGDVKKQSNSIFNKLIGNHNVFHFKSIRYDQIADYLSYAKLAIIPFSKNSLSEFILPNKIFEYSILGKPFIMTNFNKELKDLNPHFLIAKNKEEFKQLISEQMKNPYDTKKLKDFALDFEWGELSKQYKKLISSIIKK